MRPRASSRVRSPSSPQADPVRPGVHRRGRSPGRHRLVLPGRSGLHRRDLGCSGYGHVGRDLRPVRPGPGNRRCHRGGMGRPPAPRRRKGGPVRRVVHGDQPVPDGRRGRVGVFHQGDVPDHRRPRHLLRHRDPGWDPRCGVLIVLPVPAGEPQRRQPGPRTARRGGRHRQPVRLHRGAQQPPAHRDRPQPGAHLLRPDHPREPRDGRVGGVRRCVLGGPIAQ